MTEELELERTVPDDSPKPKLVDPQPVAHKTPVRPKRGLSRWLMLFAALAVRPAALRSAVLLDWFMDACRSAMSWYCRVKSWGFPEA